MLVDTAKIKQYFAKATDEKSAIKTIYNEALELTDPFTTISDSGKQPVGSRRNVDSAIADAIDAITSFIMDSILSRTGEWCELMLDEQKINEEAVTDELTVEFEEAKKYLQVDTKKVFSYIQSSNYYKEISKAVKMFVRTGTGAYVIRQTGSTSMPFIYQYVGLDNLFYIDDSLSRPNHVFKKYPEMNADEIMDRFGSDAKLPEGVDPDDLNAVTDVFEVVIAEYDEANATTNYKYMVTNAEFDFTIKELELDYNPFVIFRWDLLEGSSWGTSAVISNIDIVQELEEYKEIFKKQARRIADPSKIFFGNEELYEQLDFTEGKLNYGGDPKLEGNQMGGVNELGSSSNLMPLDKLISETRTSFRQALMVDDLVAGSMNQGKDVTATFVAYKQELFRKRFSATYELINSELLEPTFRAPFSIMLELNMLNLTTDIVPYTQLRYINALSKATDMGEVNKIMTYADIMGRLEQAKQIGITLDYSKTAEFISDKIGVDKMLVPTAEELDQIQEMKRQQMQMAMQQMGGVGGAQDQTEVQGATE